MIKTNDPTAIGFFEVSLADAETGLFSCALHIVIHKDGLVLILQFLEGRSVCSQTLGATKLVALLALSNSVFVVEEPFLFAFETDKFPLVDGVFSGQFCLVALGALWQFGRNEGGRQVVASQLVFVSRGTIKGCIAAVNTSAMP